MKVRIKADHKAHTSHEVCAEQARLAVARGIPLVRKIPVRKPLAVVGGGHPIDVEELRSFEGDIWAINGVHDWLLDRGIESALFMGDPHPCMTMYASKAKRAVLSSICHPDVFDLLEGKDVAMWHMGDVSDLPPLVGDTWDDDKPWVARGGCMTASRAHMVGIWMGYTEQHYFGCSCSYTDAGVNGPSNSHVYVKPAEHNHHEELIVLANGEYFRTNLGLMFQGECMVEMFTKFPEYFKERSGGLLRAMIADPEWTVTHMTEAARRCMRDAA